MKMYKGLNVPIEYDESIIYQKTICYDAWEIQNKRGTPCDAIDCYDCLFNYYSHQEEFNDWIKMHKRQKKLERILR